MENNLHQTYSRSIVNSLNEEHGDGFEKILMPEDNNRHVEVDKSCLCNRVTSLCSMCGGEWLFANKYSPERRDASLWCNSDVCGSICVLFTWLLILYPCIVLLVVVFMTVNSAIFCSINAPIFYIFALMSILSHVKAVFTDPGTIPRNNATNENIQQLLTQGVAIIKCTKCESIKPQRTHHCSICRRCVRKMDHHCPWINNCVGENNQKYFIMFTFYIFLMSAFAFYICIHFFIMCVKNEWSDFLGQKDVMNMNWFRFSPVTKSVMLISVGFESMVFGMFTLIMFFTQLCSICYDQTGIESLKKESVKKEKQQSCLGNLTVLFGYPLSWRWLCPVNLQGTLNRKCNGELHNI